MAFSQAEERRERRREEARRAILAAAEALLVEGGHEGLSMRRLAARSGYALPTIYHHFGDKQGLIDTILDETFREMGAAMADAPPARDPVEAVRRVIRTLISFGIENPTHYRLLVATLQEGAEPPSAEEVRGRLEEPLQALKQAGRLRAGSVEAATQALWAFSHGLISLRTSRADLPWEPDLLDVGLEGMLFGLVLADGEGDR